MKILLVYYSFEGNTDFVAQSLARQIGADVVRIHQVKEPPTGFRKYVTGVRELLSGRDVAIYSYRELDPEEYDTIILGTPVWAGTYAPALRSYLKEHPFENKGVYLFATSMSGNAHGALEKLAGRVRENYNDVLGMSGFREPLKYSNRSQIQAKKFGRKISDGKGKK